MKDISELSNSFDNFILKIEKNIALAQKESTDEMKSLVLQNIEIPEEARNKTQFIVYSTRIKKKMPEKEGNEIKSSVYSDLKVGGDSKWADVPIGAFLEWGTGPLGEDTNLYNHGYNYTTDEPWDFVTWLQSLDRADGMWGIIARPHMYPALIDEKQNFKKRVKEAINQSWME